MIGRSALYKVGLVVMALGWVDFDLNVPQCCPAALHSGLSLGHDVLLTLPKILPLKLNAHGAAARNENVERRNMFAYV